MVHELHLHISANGPLRKVRKNAYSCTHAHTQSYQRLSQIYLTAQPDLFIFLTHKCHIQIWKADISALNVELLSGEPELILRVYSLYSAQIMRLASVRTLMSNSSMPTACSSSPCQHDGTCILDSSHSYRCACLGGYTGRNCEHGEFDDSSNG